MPVLNIDATSSAAKADEPIKVPTQVTAVEAPPSSRALADRVEQLHRIVSVLGFRGGLNPAQWAALRYFGRAAPSRRTVGALADVQGVTAPTASETVSALVRKGYVERLPSVADKRSHTLALTVAGQTLLASDPMIDVAGAIGVLSDDQRISFAESLDLVLRRLVERRQQLRVQA